MTQHKLYRCFDADNELIYVGVTSDLKERIRSHKTSLSRVKELVRVESVDFESRKDALLAEKETIQRERPKYNIHFNDEKKARRVLSLYLPSGYKPNNQSKVPKIQIKDIFEKLGGVKNVSILLDVNESTAGEMKRRKAIRVCYWPTLVRVCREKRIKGVNYNMLVELHQGDKS